MKICVCKVCTYMHRTFLLSLHETILLRLHPPSLSACVLLNKCSLKDLEIPEFSDPNYQAENITHPIFKAILKFNNHQSIMSLNKLRSGSVFIFVT